MMSRVLEKAREVYEAEDKLFFAVQRSTALVLAYINQDKIPDALEGVCTEMALWLLERGFCTPNQTGDLKSIREGQVAMTFSENSRLQAVEVEMLLAFHVELDRFRKINW